MAGPQVGQHERRRALRIEPPGLIRVEAGGDAIAEAEVLNISTNGAAVRLRKPVLPGERVAFSVGGGRAPITAQVIACELGEDGWFRIRCRCILGGFDLDEFDEAE